MEDTPNDQPQGSSDVGDGELDQSMIDALMSGASGEAADAPSESTPEAPSPSDSSDADSGEMDQAMIDALMNGASGDGPSEVPAEPASGAVQEVSQADIDALMSAATGDATASAPAPAPEPEPDTRVDTLGRPFDEAAAAMQAAIEEEKAEAAAAAAAAPPPPPPPPVAPPPPTTEFNYPDFADVLGPDIDPKRVTMLNDVNLRVEIELGRTRMLVEDVLKLDEGSVVELDKLAGDPVDVYVNGRLIARGEVLVLNDNFCVRISEVMTHDPHRVSA